MQFARMTARAKTEKKLLSDGSRPSSLGGGGALGSQPWLMAAGAAVIHWLYEFNKLSN